MGNRGHVKFVDDDGDAVWVYTHDEGYRLPEMVAVGLEKANGRWRDDSYCTRIVMSHLFRGYEENLLGWGVSTREMDTSDGGRVVVLYVEKQQVQLVRRYGRDDETGGEVLSYQDFVIRRPSWDSVRVREPQEAPLNGPIGNVAPAQRGRYLARTSGPPSSVRDFYRR